MLIDTHAHIDMEDFEADFSQMLARAAENGVKKICFYSNSARRDETSFNFPR